MCGDLAAGRQKDNRPATPLRGDDDAAGPDTALASSVKGEENLRKLCESFEQEDEGFGSDEPPSQTTKVVDVGFSAEAAEPLMCASWADHQSA